ncbi:lanthionine synthetase C family protein [Pyxidicoccus sp. 3LFB2]
MTLPTKWSPLLQGDARSAALHAIDTIAAELSTPERLGALSPTLSGGQAGAALLFAYLGRSGAPGSHADLAERLLGAATEAVGSTGMLPDLYSGFTGITWAVEHLQGTLDPEEDALVGIDEALEGLLRTSPWQYHYDLVSGLVGFGVYLLERLPREGARRGLELLVARLAELAEPAGGGLRWWTPAPLVMGEMRGRFAQGACNMGVAHGMPGVLAILAGAEAAGISPEQARVLLRGGWDWLLSQRLPDTASSRFPTWLSADDVVHARQPAWCYGDPGLSLTLLTVARTAKDAAWEEEALTFCRETARRWSDVAKARDAGLCHGAAGLGHLYNRLFHETGEGLFADAAHAWFSHALSLRRPGQGVAGFSAFEFGPDGSERWVETPGLLTGAAGIGLALLAATSDVEPAWDRMLLMSLRPSPSTP